VDDHDTIRMSTIADRAVQPGADEVFDFKLVDTTGQSVTVVVVVEHADGQR
jgi:hypothetical protein